MTAKEFLMRIENIDAEIEIKASELRRPWSRATKTTTELSEDPIFSGNTSDKVGENGSEIADISREIDRLEAEKRSIVEMICLLNSGVQKKILYKHYVERKKLTVICEEIGYSYQRTVELHLIALKNLEEILTSYINI